MPIRVSGLNSGLDTDSIVKELVSAYRTKGDKLKKQQTKLSWTQDKWKSLNAKVLNLYKSLDSLRFSSGFNMKKTTVSDSTKALVTASKDSVNGTQKLNVIQTATGGYLTGEELNDTNGGKTKVSELRPDLLSPPGTGSLNGTFTIGSGSNTQQITVDENTTIDDFVKQINDAKVGVKASYDAANHRIFIASTSTGAANDFTLTPTANTDGEKILDAFGVTTGSGAHKEDAKNAIIKLNGATFESETNKFNINGMAIEALSETGDKSENAVTISTATDTQGLYDKIKDFISEYNSIINEMSSLYNADSAKGYEPLTSEEKESLSESEIADWEKKVKDSLLRRDDNLSTLINTMTSAMSKTYEINGKKYSLASLGIKTASYFTTTAANRYELHIDGDADDDTTSANADVLMSMLNSDPDAVIGIIQGAATDLYDNLGKQMKTSTLRSFQSIYNDKAMAQSYSDYTKKISAWEEKVTAMEESYYKKFAAMETALAKLQSQQSAFAGMLGGS